jgi:hypothetical protein
LPSSLLSGVCSLILFPLFATGVVDTGGNLPPVSTTQGELVAKFAAGVVDTGGKFAAGVIDTGGNLPPVSLTPVVHLGHLDLRISPRIFEKNWNDPNVIIRGLGEGDSLKKPKAKNLVTLSLLVNLHWRARLSSFTIYCNVYEYITFFAFIINVGISRADDSWNKPEAKNLVSLSL